MGQEVNRVLEKWAKMTVSNMKKVLVRGRKVNTGRLIESITYNVDSTTLNGDPSFSINMINYGFYVDRGRRKGIKAPPLEALKSWLVSPHGKSFMSWWNSKSSKKNVDNKKNAARYLQYSIKKKGIKPVKFLNQEDIAKSVGGNFISELKKAIIKESGL